MVEQDMPNTFCNIVYQNENLEGPCCPIVRIQTYTADKPVKQARMCIPSRSDGKSTAPVPTKQQASQPLQQTLVNFL